MTNKEQLRCGVAVEIWLVRHGETEWSLSGAHTSVTDIPLTERGRELAAHLHDALQDVPFAAVLVSPMQRAQETCRIAGFGDRMETEPNLMEWNYGEAEGKSTKQIRDELGQPDWNVWKDGVVGGEKVDAVGARADKVIARALAAVQEAESFAALRNDKTKGDTVERVALFAHAHILRILAARWLELPAVDGKLFALGTGSVSVLGFEREQHVVVRWNREFA